MHDKQTSAFCFIKQSTAANYNFNQSATGWILFITTLAIFSVCFHELNLICCNYRLKLKNNNCENDAPWIWLNYILLNFKKCANNCILKPGEYYQPNKRVS